ncbi:beta-glucosidase BglX [Babesia caballi]|uniref:Beta-glucosidase BglX n=1 Tax=Babesia caballi TaxID=5871 RepID=A0AAV4LRY7_BABCB|nr:beta-glucosidase BglX [Babesia caballi]
MTATVFSTPSDAYVGQGNFFIDSRINIFPKSAITPTASDSVGVGTDIWGLAVTIGNKPLKIFCNITLKGIVLRRELKRGEEVKHLADRLRSANGYVGRSNLLVPEVARCAVKQRGEGAPRKVIVPIIFNILLKLLVKAGVGERGRWRRLPHPLSELTELLERTLRNVRARPTALNKSRQEALAIEVRFQVAAGKRQIAPPAAIIVTPPIDIGERLVVEGEASEEDLGALRFMTTNARPRRTFIVRRICFSLKLGDEGSGGVADGGEDGGVDGFGVFKIVDITVNRIRVDGIVL